MASMESAASEPEHILTLVETFDTTGSPRHSSCDLSQMRGLGGSQLGASQRRGRGSASSTHAWHQHFRGSAASSALPGALASVTCDWMASDHDDTPTWIPATPTAAIFGQAPPSLAELRGAAVDFGGHGDDIKPICDLPPLPPPLQWSFYSRADAIPTCDSSDDDLAETKVAC